MFVIKQTRTGAERVQFGRTARQTLPRRNLALFPKKKLRRDPIALLQTADAQRLERILPVKYARMSLSPFAFFRGSAAVMASDLSLAPCYRKLTNVHGDELGGRYSIRAARIDRPAAIQGARQNRRANNIADYYYPRTRNAL